MTADAGDTGLRGGRKDATRAKEQRRGRSTRETRTQNLYLSFYVHVRRRSTMSYPSCTQTHTHTRTHARKRIPHTYTDTYTHIRAYLSYATVKTQIHERIHTHKLYRYRRGMCVEGAHSSIRRYHSPRHTPACQNYRVSSQNTALDASCMRQDASPMRWDSAACEL